MNLATFRNALRLLACAGFLALLGGCANSHNAYLKDGSTAYLVQCNGVFGRWSGCAGEAAERCSISSTGSYRVLARNHLDGASEAQAEASVAGQSYPVRNLLVQCQGEQLAWRVGNFVRRLPVSEG
ncbi:hypothetical protein [Pseudomonas benzopyrenica]|nr:hypothetical protein [Pseudomonas benzopyrenica]MDC7830992.1 hypothetical protein [Pseudomonas benzopyrenica]